MCTHTESISLEERVDLYPEEEEDTYKYLLGIYEVDICMHVWMYMYVRTYVCMYVCMYACMYVWMHVCIRLNL